MEGGVTDQIKTYLNKKGSVTDLYVQLIVPDLGLTLNNLSDRMTFCLTFNVSLFTMVFPIQT